MHKLTDGYLAALMKEGIAVWLLFAPVGYTLHRCLATLPCISLLRQEVAKSLISSSIASMYAAPCSTSDRGFKFGLFGTVSTGCDGSGHL